MGTSSDSPEAVVIDMDDPQAAIAEIVKRCEGMAFEEQREFTLSQAPGSLFKSYLVVRLGQAYGVGFSFYRPSGLTVSIHCFDPNDPKYNP